MADSVHTSTSFPARRRVAKPARALGHARVQNTLETARRKYKAKASAREKEAVNISSSQTEQGQQGHNGEQGYVDYDKDHGDSDEQEEGFMEKEDTDCQNGNLENMEIGGNDHWESFEAATESRPIERQALTQAGKKDAQKVCKKIKFSELRRERSMAQRMTERNVLPKPDASSSIDAAGTQLLDNTKSWKEPESEWVMRHYDDLEGAKQKIRKSIEDRRRKKMEMEMEKEVSVKQTRAIPKDSTKVQRSPTENQNDLTMQMDSTDGQKNVTENKKDSTEVQMNLAESPEIVKKRQKTEIKKDSAEIEKKSLKRRRRELQKDLKKVQESSSKIQKDSHIQKDSQKQRGLTNFQIQNSQDLDFENFSDPVTTNRFDVENSVTEQHNSKMREHEKSMSSNSVAGSSPKRKRFKNYVATSKRVIINPSSESESDSFNIEAASLESLHILDSGEEAAQGKDASQESRNESISMKEMFGSESDNSDSRPGTKRLSLFVEDDDSADPNFQLFVPSDSESFASMEKRHRLADHPETVQSSKANSARNSLKSEPHHGPLSEENLMQHNFFSEESLVEKEAPSNPSMEKVKRDVRSSKRAKLNKKRKSGTRKLNRLKKKGVATDETILPVVYLSSSNEEGNSEEQSPLHQSLVTQTSSHASVQSKTQNGKTPKLQDDGSYKAMQDPQTKRRSAHSSENHNNSVQPQTIIENNRQSDESPILQVKQSPGIKSYLNIQISSPGSKPHLDSSISYTSPPEVIVLDSDSEPQTSKFFARLRKHQRKSTKKTPARAHPDSSYTDASSVVIPNSSQSVESQPTHPPGRSQMRIASSPNQSMAQPNSSPVVSSRIGSVSQTTPQQVPRGPPIPSSTSKSVFEQMKERFKKSGVDFQGFGIDAEIFSDFI